MIRLKLFFWLIVFIASPLCSYNDFEYNRLIPKNQKEEMRKYILPKLHPLKPILDLIFLNNRATLNENTLTRAGFKMLFSQPRSYIKVARHPWLQGYLLKIMMDSELREKQGHPEWHWFMERCRGAKKIRKVINKHNITHFEVPKKWIYPLPLKPSPPMDSEYTQKAVILIVEDMHIVDDKTNKRAWKEEITYQHLDELYIIISEAQGSSYRAENIPFTVRGTFAFIDTEYPNHKPDYRRIRKSLTCDKAHYWDSLVGSEF